ncbi:hypothetical protein OROGR_022985 [Orobanche gracilis]
MVGEISISTGGGLMGQADQNLISVVQAKFKEVETMFKGWVAKHSLLVEAAVATVTGGAKGAVCGALMWTVYGDYASLLVTRPLTSKSDTMASLKLALDHPGGPLVHARNFAIMIGVSTGISCVMRRVRGKKDVQTSMAAAFGSGAMFSLVSRAGGPNQAVNAVTCGLVFALVQGGVFQLCQELPEQPQLGQKLSQELQAEDLNYIKTRLMLRDLGLQNYEKNFKRGLLSDSTLALLNDGALKDLNIPPGPRLRILDHIEGHPELKERQK